ncbi:MAG: hypothetical protein IPO27_14935 [Bacteroidetes bacterium]|nr:hypothetical protein [Bacteroidota bacterium]
MENFKTIIALVALAVYYIYRQYNIQQSEALKRKAEIEKELPKPQALKQPRVKMTKQVTRPARKAATPTISSLESLTTTYHNLEEEGMFRAAQHQHETQTHLAYELADSVESIINETSQNVINNGHDLRTMILHYEILSAPKCLRA